MDESKSCVADGSVTNVQKISNIFRFRRSYFAFNLASEHHKFYMQLRDSYISIKHISNELNVPLTHSRSGSTKASDIYPGDYESAVDKDVPPQSAIDDKTIKIIDKQTRSTGLRVRNLKKSMLNDNKLIKLRDKLLKRSKSTVGISLDDANRSPKAGCSKEENQNKENELPKNVSATGSASSLSTQQPSPHQQQQSSPSKLVSPNRNRVKMGTRVFSSHFLNKSFDNIYDHAVDVYQFDDDLLDGRSSRNGIAQTIKSDISHDPDGRNSQNNTIDGLSLRSGSLSSLYYSGSPLPCEAYVLRK